MGTMGELHEVLAHVFSGRLKPVLDKTFPLSEARAAHQYLEKARQILQAFPASKGREGLLGLTEYLARQMDALGVCA